MKRHHQSTRPRWWKGVSLLIGGACFSAGFLAIVDLHLRGILLPLIPRPFAIAIAFPVAILVICMIVAGMCFLIGEFDYPQWVRQCIVRAVRFVRNKNPNRYSTETFWIVWKEGRFYFRPQIAFSALLKGAMYGAGVVVFLLFSLTAAGLFAPPYTGPTTPTSIIQDAHMIATRLATILTTRPDLFFTGLAAPLVVLILGSWARRHCKFN